jgi:hypothetical protein
MFSPGTPGSSTNKIDLHDITEILLKAALNTINPKPFFYFQISNKNYNEFELSFFVHITNKFKRSIPEIFGSY